LLGAIGFPAHSNSIANSFLFLGGKQDDLESSQPDHILWRAAFAKHPRRFGA
jgi:hypothetical protein